MFQFDNYAECANRTITAHKRFIVCVSDHNYEVVCTYNPYECHYECYVADISIGIKYHHTHSIAVPSMILHNVLKSVTYKTAMPIDVYNMLKEAI